MGTGVLCLCALACAVEIWVVGAVRDDDVYSCAVFRAGVLMMSISAHSPILMKPCSWQCKSLFF